ncbi:SEC-C motif domain protein [Candidatus Magnetomorum sp. HK-1]|nr:SEC-C motif domain protein [Candidatus Magnetomorum sp. HK-1]
MKIGRNTPCPCGSGKKYKKCCLRKDEEKANLENHQKNDNEIQDNNSEKSIAHKEDSLENDLNVDHIKPIEQDINTENNSYQRNESSSLKNERDQFWKTFRKSDFNKKVSIVETILDNPDEFKKYDFFEIVESIYSSCQNSNENMIVKKIIHKVKLEYPENYEDDIAYFLDFQIKLALAEHDLSEANKLLLEFADNADSNIDIFFEKIDHFSYYSDLDLLLNLMHRGWKKIKNTYDIMDYPISEYARQSAEFEIFKYVKESSNPTFNDDILLSKLNIFIEPDIEHLKCYIAHITGNSDHVWTQEDFNYKCKMSKPTKKKKGKPQKKPKRVPLNVFSQNVYYLTCEFMEYLLNTEGFLFPKARLAHLEIKSYIVSRAEGVFEEKGYLIKRMLSSKSKKQKRVFFFEHILCPDKDTTDKFISNTLTIWSLRLFSGIVFYETIPAWLRFIESKGLIDDQIRQNTLISIYELFGYFKRIIEKKCKDSTYFVQQIEKAYNFRVEK